MTDRSFADDTNGWENALFFIEFKTIIYDSIVRFMLRIAIIHLDMSIVIVIELPTVAISGFMSYS